MNKTILSLALLLAAGAALADDAGLQRCRTITNSAQRLACYDALPLGVMPAPTAPSASNPPATPGAAPSAAAAAPAPAAKPSLLSRFGFEQRAQPDELPSVESYIPGRFEGWGPNEVIKLANGQAWQVTDGTSRSAWVENPKVKVTRGMMGSFFLEIDKINPAPRVRRVQ